MRRVEVFLSKARPSGRASSSLLSPPPPPPCSFVGRRTPTGPPFTTCLNSFTSRFFSSSINVSFSSTSGLLSGLSCTSAMRRCSPGFCGSVSSPSTLPVSSLLCPSLPAAASKRFYTHWKRTAVEDFELPFDTLPKNMSELLQTKNPEKLDFFENYWYWRLRSESHLLDAKTLPSKSYRQLAKDLGMQIVTEHSQHYIGLLELYEYLKSAPFVGPFGTLENPVIVPSFYTERYVACTGGTGDNEHHALWFRCREGFLYRCGECDQIFMLVRVLSDFEQSDKQTPEDADVLDVFDKSIISKAQKEYNRSDYIKWPLGDKVYNQMFMEGAWGNEIPTLTAEQPQLEPLKDHMS